MSGLTDTVLIVDGLVVAALVIADLWWSRDDRLAVAERARARWAFVHETPVSRLIARAGARLHSASTGVLLRGPLRWRFAAFALITSTALGGIALVGGALVYLPDPRSSVAHAVSFFALPAVAGGSLSLALDHWFLGALGRNPRLSVQSGLVLLRVVAVVAAWLAVMHAGTWLEWQQKRTPLAYGSEWFYAQVYLSYLREPAGRLVSWTAGIMVAWLPVLFLSWSASLAVLKLLHPLLAPVFAGLLERFARARRGVLAGWAAAVGLLAALGSIAARGL